MNKRETANRRPELSSSGKAAVLGLVFAAIGILIQFLAGGIKQLLPIGTIILLVEAGLISFGRWRWTLIVTEIMTLFIFIMGFIAPGLFDRLSHPSIASNFYGTWIQEIGLIVALIGCGIAIMQSYKSKDI